MIGLAGTFYFGAALVLGLGFVWASLRFWRDATPDVARKLFRYSILYLPVLLLLLVADRVRG
jgi:protoheme IX farnesyltransferase